MPTTLEALIKRTPLDRLLKQGKVLDIRAAMRQTGYSRQHLHRLCAKRRVGHFRRGATHYFLPEHLAALFKTVRPRPSRELRA